MNLTLIALATCAALACTMGAYMKGRGDGEDIERAKQSSVDDVVRKSNAAAMNAAASAIAGIQIKQVTIKQRVEHEISSYPVYADCHHSPDGLRGLNDALTNTVGSRPVGGVELPASAASR